MPPTSSPRDNSHRLQPTGHRQTRVSPPSRPILPPPHAHAMSTAPATRGQHLRPIRPYPQPGRSHSSPSSMPPPRIIAPPPHTLPQTPTATNSHRARPLPQVSSAPMRSRPLYSNPTSIAADFTPLADLADVAMTMPPAIPWRRIHPAVIPDIPNGLPQYPPGSAADAPLGTVPPPSMLPPVSTMLESAAPISVPVTKVIRHWMDAQERKMQLSPAVGPNTTAGVSWRTISSAPVTESSSTSTAVPADRESQDPSPPLSDSSSATTKKKRRIGESPEEGEESPKSNPLANLTLSGPSSPDRAKASRDWHEASRRMLHPRSVWSPESPPSSLPDEDRARDEAEGEANTDQVDKKVAERRPSAGPISSPKLLPQTPAVLRDPSHGDEETQHSRVQANNPLNYMLGPPKPDDSQETIDENLITPSSSFTVSPTIEKDDPFPPLVSPLNNEDRDRDEPSAVEPKLPLVVKPLDHPDGKRSMGRFEVTE